MTPYLHNIPHLRDAVGTEKVAYVKWGFHENMIRSHIQRTDKHEHDALFIGLVKGDRNQKLLSLMHDSKIKVKMLTSADHSQYATMQSRVPNLGYLYLMETLMILLTPSDYTTWPRMGCMFLVTIQKMRTDTWKCASGLVQIKSIAGFVDQH